MLPKKRANVRGFLSCASKISDGRVSKRAASRCALQSPPTKTASGGTEHASNRMDAIRGSAALCLTAQSPTMIAIPAATGIVSNRSTRIGATTVFDQTNSR